MAKTITKNKTNGKKNLKKKEEYKDYKDPETFEESKEEVITIPFLNIKIIKVPISSITQFIVNKFSERAIMQIENKQGKVATQGRTTRNPEQEYKDAVHHIPEDDKKKITGFPAIGFKKAIVAGCRQYDGNNNIPMTVAKGSFHVMGDHGDLVEIKYKSKEKRKDRVVIGNGITDIRYRPGFNNWSTTLTISLNVNKISIPQLLNIIEAGGYSNGVGEWRPGAPKSTGWAGRFSIDRERVTIFDDMN